MKSIFRKCRGFTLLCMGIFLFSVGVQGEEPRAVYSGSVRGDYVFRNLGEYDDHDAYGYWYFRGRDLAEKRVEIYTSGRLHSDLDGKGYSVDDPFQSIDDDSDVRLLQIYADIHDSKKKMALRLGRQYVDVADYIQVDGAQAMLFEKQTLGGRVFLGRPVSEYSSTSGDLFLGASLVGRPWKENLSRITYARYEDDSEAAEDNHYFLDVQQKFMDEVRLRSYLSIMNDDIRMGGADLIYVSMEDRVLDAVLGLQRWGDYSASTRAYSPLTEVLGDLDAFTSAYGRLTIEVLPWLYLSPGAMTRQPDDSNLTNRRFEQYDFSLIFEPQENLSATLAFEYWDVEDDDQFFALSGDIRYAYRRLWELTLGAAFVDYTYLQLADTSVASTFDPNTFVVDVQPLDGTRVQRSPNVLTYYLRAKWNITQNTSLRVSGEIEDDSDVDDLGYQVRTSFEVRL